VREVTFNTAVIFFVGVYAPKPDQIKAAPDNLALDGQHHFETSSKAVYQGKFGELINQRSFNSTNSSP